MTAQLKHLEDQISYCTIDITIREKKPLEAKVEAKGIDGLGERISVAFRPPIGLKES